VFVTLHEEGLIYRDRYLINWCPRCRTALSDLEVEHKETKGELYYLRYPYAEGDGTRRGRDHATRDAARRHGSGGPPGRRALPGLLGKQVVLPISNAGSR